MGRQRNQIEVVERQISVVDHDMEVLLAELGMHILELRQPVLPDDAVATYHQLAQDKTILDDIDARIDNLRHIGQRLLDAHARISKLKQSITDHESRLKTVYGRVGVIAWEEATSGVLSDIIRKQLPLIDEMQAKVAALKQTKDTATLRSQESFRMLRLPFKLHEFVATRRLERYSKGHEEFFIQIGQSIASAASIKHLQSRAAMELEKEFRDLARDISVWEEELSLLQQRISSDKGKLEEVGVAGSIERKIQELQNQRKGQAEQVRRLAVDCGRAVCTLENPWKSQEVNAEILRCYDQIRRHERIRAQLVQRIAELKLEQEIGVLISLVEQDEERILHLQKLIDQYNLQIEDIQRTIVENREEIGKLKQRLTSSLEREGL